MMKKIDCFSIHEVQGVKTFPYTLFFILNWHVSEGQNHRFKKKVENANFALSFSASVFRIMLQNTFLNVTKM